MRIYFMILLFCMYRLAGFGQLVFPSLTNSMGKYGIAGNIRFEFSLGESFTATISNNTTITQGLLQPLADHQGAILPVMGLEFRAQRLSTGQVQLSWKTIQEIGNSGFFIERRKEKEASFASIGFRPSAAPGGNASLPLQYQAIDTDNDGTGTYYRLKQVDRDSNFAYSAVRFVDGRASQSVTLKAWPVPSFGVVNITAGGIEKGQLLVFDQAGRLVKQVAVTSQTVTCLTGLTPGTYLVMLADHKEITQRIIIQ